MVTYDLKKQENISEIFNHLLLDHGKADLYALDINWVEDGTSEFLNNGGEVLLFADKDSVMSAYEDVLSSLLVDDYSFVDVSVSCYNVSKEEIDFPLTDNDLIEYYAEHMDSNNEFLSRRIKGNAL